eukprot:UN34082
MAIFSSLSSASIHVKNKLVHLVTAFTTIPFLVCCGFAGVQVIGCLHSLTLSFKASLPFHDYNYWVALWDEWFGFPLPNEDVAWVCTFAILSYMATTIVGVIYDRYRYSFWKILSYILSILTWCLFISITYVWGLQDSSDGTLMNWDIWLFFLNFITNFCLGRFIFVPFLNPKVYEDENYGWYKLLLCSNGKLITWQTLYE